MFISILSVVLCLFYDPFIFLGSATVHSIWTMFWGIIALLSMPLGLLFVDN
jgi:hypothetical protein